jgi:hypothetical protein
MTTLGVRKPATLRECNTCIVSGITATVVASPFRPRSTIPVPQRVTLQRIGVPASSRGWRMNPFRHAASIEHSDRPDLEAKVLLLLVATRQDRWRIWSRRWGFARRDVRTCPTGQECRATDSTWLRNEVARIVFAPRRDCANAYRQFGVVAVCCECALVTSSSASSSWLRSSSLRRARRRASIAPFVCT